MNITELEIGDVVYAAKDITDDGSMPDCSEGQVLASSGSRGVIVMKGHIEETPQQAVFLVRFEDESLTLGRPIGCWAEDLSIDRQ
ncbi:nitrogen fixation protein NifZ [Methylotuvimicrobium buryatense]|uniref:Nitrogen fixation protein NifZ n=1 Tax=Methylotuvimicrobium buryatense TaxID=95641 RepID=A0A4P9UVT1_METBY|nr:nitrogen fixation protein NifZ [Methylotuvimicrobium buryatense]QCW83826.1 nitrogen fixation protein NifZ [Methylotuvimicrobium buryatense]